MKGCDVMGDDIKTGEEQEKSEKEKEEEKGKKSLGTPG